MLTLVTCWYSLKSKFTSDTYHAWINNIQTITRNNTFNLVIYTDVEYADKLWSNCRTNNIKIISMSKEEWYNYKYSEFWKQNQKKNILLPQIDWELNCLWAEKISFVKRAMESNYFNNCNDWYGWCDIGYFRDRSKDTPVCDLVNWPNYNVLNNMNHNRIQYGMINNNIGQLYQQVMNKNKEGLPLIPIPDNQNSVAGGFFLVHKNMVLWYWSTFDQMLCKYIHSKRLVKDDQIIVINIIFNNMENFQLHWEDNPQFDNWFMFQRVLK